MPVRVRPRIDPGPDPLELVAVQGEQHDRRRQPPTTSTPEVDEVGAGQDEHRQPGHGEDHRRPEVGLLEDERDDRQEDDQERHRAAPAARRSRSPAWPASGRGRRRGRAWRTRPGGPPAAGRSSASAPSRRPTWPRLGTKTRTQQDDRDRVERDRHEPEPAVVDPRHREHREEPSDAPRRPAGATAPKTSPSRAYSFIADDEKTIRMPIADSAMTATRIDVVGLVGLAPERLRRRRWRRRPGVEPRSQDASSARSSACASSARRRRRRP